MSKRKKNYPDPMQIINKHGSDALRWVPTGGDPHPPHPPPPPPLALSSLFGGARMLSGECQLVKARINLSSVTPPPPSSRSLFLVRGGGGRGGGLGCSQVSANWWRPGSILVPWPPPPPTPLLSLSLPCSGGGGGGSDALRWVPTGEGQDQS